VVDPVTFSVEPRINSLTFTLHMPGPIFPADLFSALGPVPVSLLDPFALLIEPIIDTVTSFVQLAINSITTAIKSLVDLLSSQVIGKRGCRQQAKHHGQSHYHNFLHGQSSLEFSWVGDITCLSRRMENGLVYRP